MNRLEAAEKILRGAMRRTGATSLAAWASEVTGTPLDEIDDVRRLFERDLAAYAGGNAVELEAPDRYDQPTYAVATIVGFISGWRAGSRSARSLRGNA